MQRPARRGGTAAARLAVVLAAALLSPALALAHGSHDERIAAQGRLIQAAPGDARLHLDRAAVHLDRRDWAAALADLDRAAALDPDLAAVHYLRGLVLWRRGSGAEAEAALGHFLAAAPGAAEGFAMRGRVRADLGRPLAAARDLSRALALRPDAGPDLYLERAGMLADAGGAHLAEALQGLEAGMAALGPLPALALAAVEIEVRLGRFDAAARRLDEATRDFSVRAPWLVRRGEILEAGGDTEAARRAYRDGVGAIATLPAHRQGLPAFAGLRARALEGLGRLEGR